MITGEQSRRIERSVSGWFGAMPVMPSLVALAAGVETAVKAQGCPFAADYDGDGTIDLVLGAKDGMDTATGGLLPLAWMASLAIQPAVTRMALRA